VLALFANEGFAYTLNPPRLGEHNVDDFLFGTRRWFLRALRQFLRVPDACCGIPARVVAGYQGGEVNDLSGTVQVRQYDAHAWPRSGCLMLAGTNWTRRPWWHRNALRRLACIAGAGHRHARFFCRQCHWRFTASHE
jgi:hypothetical protein